MSDYTRGRADAYRTAEIMARRRQDVGAIRERVVAQGEGYARGYLDGLEAWVAIAWRGTLEA